MHSKKRFSIFVFMILLPSAFQFLGYSGCSWPTGDGGGTIKLTWDSSTEPGIVGYKIYYGTAPGRYGPGIDVGNVTTFTLDGLIKGQKYYITVTAYDKAGKQSGFSTEVTGIAK